MEPAKDERLSKIGDVLINDIPDPATDKSIKEGIVKEKTKKDINEETLIKNVNNKVLLDILSPEIKDNENAKRKHKFILIGLLAAFLIIQFLAVGFISDKVISYAILETSKAEIVNSLLTFVTGYITSVVIELIAILKYIVKNVFDTSLIELVKIFKETDKILESQDE